MPGHTLAIKVGMRALPAQREYWDVNFAPDATINEADALGELRERLRESVKLRLISEVPLGAFLSGGVDSSAVVATMAGLSADPVNTCSIGFTDPAFDEAAYARQVADLYHTNHRVGDRRERRFRPDRSARAHLRRALRRQLRDSHLPRMRAGAQERHRRAVRRRR